MTPDEFVTSLDEWLAGSEAALGRIPRNHTISTRAEAEAVCRALAAGDRYTSSGLSKFYTTLHDLAAYFQSVTTKEASAVLREEGLPRLRRILHNAMEDPLPADTYQRHGTHLFVLKVLLLYRERGDGGLLLKAARLPTMADHYLWSVLFQILVDDHPDAVEISDGLRDPLPDGLLGVDYLDFANAMALRQRISRHAFDTEQGIARLAGYLDDRKPEHYGYAVSATASLPFLSAAARELLMPRADRHPDPLVRLEAAWALAKAGSEFGWQRLAQLCLNPRFAERAMRYLEELGLGAHIPAKARDPDFQAMAEMCSWLAHPNELGRPPDHISLCDTRVLKWPPTGDQRRLWLFNYRYEAQGEEAATEGVGLVGSVTFALFGEATADLPPEDVYALHCCWELQMQDAPRAPKNRSAATGRAILAAANPDFSRSS